MKTPHFYKEHPKRCARDDFWGQVKRTVHGKPVSQEQIDMIVAAVRRGLQLAKGDWLLDLCCGNGALSRLIFAQCAGGVGVDYSEPLISVAKEYFECPPRETYVLEDVVEFVTHTVEMQGFTKALCYGSFQYLWPAQAQALLRGLRQRCSRLDRVFIGNLPDKALMQEFYREHNRQPEKADDPTSSIGLWRTREEFAALVSVCGWQVTFDSMPAQFYAAHYRYDAVLTPREGES